MIEFGGQTALGQGRGNHQDRTNDQEAVQVGPWSGALGHSKGPASSLASAAGLLPPDRSTRQH